MLRVEKQVLLSLFQINNFVLKHFCKVIIDKKSNEKLDKLIKHKNIINYIKAQRLSWFGHVQRMPDTRTVKKI